MKRNNTPWSPVQAANLQWTDHGVPCSVEFDDFYYSTEDGPQESRHVLLQPSQLAERWREDGCDSFCIAETGFGSGLNFLLSWELWQQVPQPRPRLHYIAIEKHPLSLADMTRALASRPALTQCCDDLLAQYPDLLPGQHRLILAGGQLILDLWWEDVSQALPDLAASKQQAVDAWFLDGFTPARNPEMWLPAHYQAMAAASRPGASFATFTAAGDVRRGLLAAGFEVTKTPGFGKKRESLHGVLAKVTATPPPIETPWEIAANKPASPRSVLVVGAGLAGCTVAAALARRNIKVTVVERQAVAAAGSGNDQGVLYTRLSHKHSTLTDFALQSFGFSQRYYRQLFHSGQLSEGDDGALCGSFHQHHDQSELDKLAPILATVPELAQVLDAAQASELLGIEQSRPGYWFPRSGWMRPASICQALLDHPNIALLSHSGEVTLQRAEHQWQAVADQQIIAQSDCAVVATGIDAANSAELNWLPLQAVRGQTTNLPAGPTFQALQSALCHSGYISPARAGQHCMGATFNLRDDNPELRIADHQFNLEALATAVPQWQAALAELDVRQLSGRVGFRCATPDYLPIAGPVPELAPFLADYAELRKNAKHIIDTAGSYIPGLYVSTGHGSRGLTSTPLAAELLASLICDEALPLSRELYRAVAPGRFLIRDLCRNRI